MATGAFINFELVFQVKPKDGGLNNDQQAIEILKKARHLLAVEFPVVAIIYSANEEQTRALVKAYAAGNYMAGIDGANQAKVMQALEAHLGGQDWKDLQMKVRIAPITTIPNPGTDPVQIVNADIARIRGQLDEGWAILGRQNQKYHQPTGPSLCDWRRRCRVLACRYRSGDPGRTEVSGSFLPCAKLTSSPCFNRGRC